LRESRRIRHERTYISPSQSLSDSRTRFIFTRLIPLILGLTIALASLRYLTGANTFW